MSTPYSPGYYESLKEDSALSAKEVVPIIVRLLQPKSVVDVGCGSGTWAREYLDQGIEVLGLDGDEVGSCQLLIPEDRFRRQDLAKPFQLDRQFDVVNCLEVAEHLHLDRAQGFVNDICKISDLIVFSAAVPGQGGTHHVNEQWPSYWIQKFEANGFRPLDCVRHQIWANNRVAWWYIQNLFIYIRNTRMGDFPDVQSETRSMPTDLVHPRAYVRATVPSEMSPRMLKEVVRAIPYFPAKILKHLGR